MHITLREAKAAYQVDWMQKLKIKCKLSGKRI